MYNKHTVIKTVLLLADISDGLFTCQRLMDDVVFKDAEANEKRNTLWKHSGRITV